MKFVQVVGDFRFRCVGKGEGRFERGADLELLYTLKSEWYCYRDAYRRIEDWAEQNLPPEPTVYQEGYC